MRCVVSCEHASNALPDECGTLGLDPAALQSHVAWDPGAADIAVALAARLNAPCELGSYSRLVVDLNRSANNPAIIPCVAFGVPVPGNASLSAEAIEHRIASWHRPYWERVQGHIDGSECLHLSIHSFTPELDPEHRTFPIGLLFDPSAEKEARLVERMAFALRGRGYEVAYNEPYPGSMDLITTALRARCRGYVGVEIEINHAIMKGPWQLPLVDALIAGLG